MYRFVKIVNAFIGLTAVIMLSSNAWAAELRFVLEDEPIYTSSSKDYPGFLMEVVKEMTEVLKVHPVIEFHAWGKAQELAADTPNTIIFPLARTAAREPRYLWIVKVFDVRTVFINRKGDPVIETLDQAKKLDKIGVIEATPYQDRLRELGFDNIVPMPSTDLQSAFYNHEVDAVCTPFSEFAFAWKKAGYTIPLQSGVLLQTAPLWIAASKKSDAINVDEWIEAFEIVQQEGKFDLLFERYFGSGK